MINQITVSELKRKINNSETLLLIDVREDFERELYHIGGRHIPMHEVLMRANEIQKDIPVVFYCQKGIRSSIVIQRLIDKFGFDNLLNLKGGMEEWQKTFKSENENQ